MILKFRLGEDRKNKIVAFSNIFADLVDDLELKDSFIISELKEKWPSYVGNILSAHSFPDRIYNKFLFINVDHSAFSSELSIHAADILKKIKRFRR
jgi:hypothetical protein